MQSQFRIREWLIDVDRARIIRRDTEVRIDPKVMQVLVYLAEHADDVAPKEKIIDAVWEEAFVTDEVLTNAVWELRKALGDDAKNPAYIQTVPRKGYRLIAPITWDGREPPSSEVLPSALKKKLVKASAVILLILAGVVTYFVWERSSVAPAPSFKQLTFRRGKVTSARFTPDGHTIIYSAAWEGKQSESFLTRLDSDQSTALGLPGSTVLATAAGEMAVLLSKPDAAPYVGTLARIPIDGGAPREILEGVEDADWSSDGASFAVVRQIEGKNRLEFPVGTVLYESDPLGWIEAPRISPRGDAVAFVDHPSWDTSGSIAIVDLSGNKRTLSDSWNEIGGVWMEVGGMEWSPNGNEIWYTVREVGGRAWGLRSITPSREERFLHVSPGLLILHDVSPEDHLLLTQGHLRAEVFALAPTETEERDLTWLDGTTCPILSEDGQIVVFTESGQAGGTPGGVYLRRTDGSTAVRLGDGVAWDLSPDGNWVLTLQRSSRTEALGQADMVLLPTGAGEATRLPRGSISHYQWALWLPDGERIVVLGNEADKPTRLFVQGISDGEPRPITPEGTTTSWDSGSNTIPPNGQFVAAVPGPWRENKHLLYPVDGGEPQSIPGHEVGERPWRWSADGRYLFILEGSMFAIQLSISRLDLRTGTKEPWKELSPADPAGVSYIAWVSLVPDGDSYTYAFFRYLSDLYLAEGLR